MAISEEYILKRVKNLFPSWRTILDDASRMLDAKLTKDYVRENFCSSILELERQAYDIFSDHESRAFPELVVMWMEAHSSEIDQQHQKEVMESLRDNKPLGIALKSVVRSVVQASFPTIKKFQITVSQMRKKRAGETFQEIILRLLKRIDIPCEKARGTIEAELGHTDIVIPNLSTAINTPDKALFIACQRTLAERWWSSTSISSGGRRGYIVTIDPKLGKAKANRLNEHHLVVYVRDDVKAHADLKSMEWIRRLSDLPNVLKWTSER